MLGGAERSNRDFAVLGASVLMDALAVVGAVDIHFPAAVGAIHQPGQWCGLAPAVRVSLDIPSDALYAVKGFLIDDGLMGVFSNVKLTKILSKSIETERKMKFLWTYYLTPRRE